MAPTPRQAEILGVLKMRGKAAISELSELLEVSDETVRRDLKGLSADPELVEHVKEKAREWVEGAAAAAAGGGEED